MNHTMRPGLLDQAVMGRWTAILAMGLLTSVWASAQDSADRAAAVPAATTPNPNAVPNSTVPPFPPNNTVSEKWHFFLHETANPLILGAGAFNAAVSQATNSDPQYGQGFGAYSERFGASTADIATQNFFGDFVMASVLHEDTRYRRRGSQYGGVWKRAGYAVSRAFVTRTDHGGSTFNFSNLTGTGISAGLSNLYYPPASRNASATGMHFATSLVGAGLANLYPEFWPDFRAMLRRHHILPKGH